MVSPVIFLQSSTPVAADGAAAAPGTGLSQVFSNLSQKISGAIPYLWLSVLVFVLSLLIARLAARAVNALTMRVTGDGNLAQLLGGFTSIIISLLGGISAVLVLFPAYNPLEVLGALAALSVAVSFVFKDMADSFFSGVMILWRKPFNIGDEISVDKFEGTVVGFTFRSTKIKTYQNELVFISNSHIYASPLIVKTAFESHVVQLKVGIGYSDDLERGREVIEKATREAEGVFIEPAPKAYVTEFGDSSVDLTVFFLTEAKHLNIVAVSDRVATNIKKALDDAGIDMPYPHSVVEIRSSEGSSAKGPSTTKE